MTPREIRIECIKAVAQTGVREPARLIADAAKLEDWVNAADEEKPQAPQRGTKVADKA